MDPAAFYQMFPLRIRNMLQHAELNLEFLQEIRIRVNAPIFLQYRNREQMLTKEGERTEALELAYCAKAQDIGDILDTISGYSIYAFEEELRNGFLTVEGGHRIGVTGKVTIDNGKIQYIRNICFLNIRLSHQVPGCADVILPYLIRGNRIMHTLLISPPGCGKTTLLRDLIRQISNGTGLIPGSNVGVVDERSELAGSYRGIPQNDLGIRTDVLEGSPKAEGITMLLRSMAPGVIAVDEIGSERDAEALENVFYCGCKLIATAHGGSVDEIKKLPLLNRLLKRGMFERIVVLSRMNGPGTVQIILDEKGNVLFEGEAALADSVCPLYGEAVLTDSEGFHCSR